MIDILKITAGMVLAQMVRAVILGVIMTFKTRRYHSLDREHFWNTIRGVY